MIYWFWSKFAPFGGMRPGSFFLFLCFFFLFAFPFADFDRINRQKLCPHKKVAPCRGFIGNSCFLIVKMHVFFRFWLKNISFPFENVCFCLILYCDALFYTVENVYVLLFFKCGSDMFEFRNKSTKIDWANLMKFVRICNEIWKNSVKLVWFLKRAYEKTGGYGRGPPRGLKKIWTSCNWKRQRCLSKSDNLEIKLG